MIYYKACQQSFQELDDQHDGRGSNAFMGGFGSKPSLINTNQVPVDMRNFRTMPQKSLIKNQNDTNVKLNYSAARVERSTDHLNKEFRKNWDRMKHIMVASGGMGASLLSNGAEETLRQQYRGEYETWQLINELFSAEKLYFEKVQEKAHGNDEKKDLCPKTLEYETLTADHATTMVHAVALWLEKIYDTEDKKMQMTAID